ncbi:MAG: OmpA family protein [Bacteroidales bacterium]|nr:OmpA family protein [Bacteroidales bacterium]
MKKLVLLCICLAFTLITRAQTEDKKWNIGLHGGITQYAGDLGSDFYKFDQAWYGFGGLSVSRYIVNHFDINLMITKGTVGYTRTGSYFNSGFTFAFLNFKFNLLNSRNAVNPFVFVGGGIMVFDKDLEINPHKLDWAAPSFGGGINFRLSKSLNLNLQETFIYSTSDKRDGNDVLTKENDFYLLHTVGITFNFGKKKDADNDGVSDRNDKCPNTPVNVAVDKDGCPFDGDKDGVADYLDACPDIAGIILLNGCPDKDGDGITDKDDRCPDAVGPLSLKGCPDTDGDGVPDIDDLCPDTQAGYKVNSTGCPMDNDNDGLINENDRCPDAAGPESLKGCPDTDGDGVADIDDRCPAVVGTIANKGCPEIAKEDLVKITNIASKIFFEFDSDKLKVASLAQLDELVVILKKYETANLTIEGHADSKGSDDYNLTLSQQRTDAVKTYLMGKGIMESRLTAIGFGETRPIADNNTDAGRAKNRRVELKTSY